MIEEIYMIRKKYQPFRKTECPEEAIFLLYITLYFLHLFINIIFMLYFDKRKQFCAVVRNYRLALLRDICPNSLVLSDRED